MIQENELVALIIQLGVLAFILPYRRRLAALPSWNLLFTAFLVLFAGRTLTVVEGFFETEWVNLIEHLTYLAFAGLIAYWCSKVFRTGAESS